MSFTKILKIENKIFTKADIQHIWEEISQEGETTSTLEFEDGTKYSSKSDEILKDGKMIDYKKCERIKIKCNNFLDKKFISFELNAKYSDGSLIIESEDENWNSGNFDRLSCKINSVKNQIKWINKAKWIKHSNIILILIVFFSIFISILFELFIFIFKINKELKTFTFLLFLVFNVIFYNFIFFSLFSLFPNIEFDFGPKNLKYAKKWRNRLKYIFGIVFTIIVGLAGSYIYDKIK